MKHLIAFLLFIIFVLPFKPALAQEKKDDTKIKITLDSTGYSASHPHDIPDEAGWYIHSDNGREALRIYGSLQMLTNWDNKKNFHAYDLTMPTIPTGTEDIQYPNSTWTINMSRLGLDVLLGRDKLSDLLIRFEVDWKGDTEKFRIRHLYLRSEHWLVGKTWSSFNNVNYLVQAIDGRFAGGGVGTRPPQIRYYNKIKKWKYQVSLEYSKPSLIQPDTLGAESVQLIPNFAVVTSKEFGSFNIMLAGILRFNQVQYTTNTGSRQSLAAYGGILAAKLHINESNRLMASATAGKGIGNLMGDFAFVPIDLSYDSFNGEFENVGVYSSYVGIEHNWSKDFSSSLGWGITGAKAKSYFPNSFYENGSKVIINLFYSPAKKIKKLIVAVEAEYAERRNIESPSNNTTRIGALIIYNF